MTTNRTRIGRAGAAIALPAAIVLLLASPARPGPADARGAGELRDLQLPSEQPTDRATAQVTAFVIGGATSMALKVQGLDHVATGTTLGAHVHTGPCVEGDGLAAGGHYHTGGAINPQTEVWLDFTVGANGTGRAQVTVPFVIPEGAAQSVVIHRDPTQEGTGVAGPRWACLPVQF